MTIPAHAEFIHAFADGKTLQFQYENKGWIDWTQTRCPDFSANLNEWRIKPESKVTRYLAYEDIAGWIYFRKENNLPPTNGFKRIPALDKEVIMEDE